MRERPYRRERDQRVLIKYIAHNTYITTYKRTYEHAPHTTEPTKVQCTTTYVHTKVHLTLQDLHKFSVLLEELHTVLVYPDVRVLVCLLQSTAVSTYHMYTSVHVVCIGCVLTVVLLKLTDKQVCMGCVLTGCLTWVQHKKLLSPCFTHSRSFSNFVLNILCHLLVNNTVLATKACFQSYYPNSR